MVQGFGALEELEEANARLLTWKVTAETKAETISQQAEDRDRSSEVLVVNPRTWRVVVRSWRRCA